MRILSATIRVAAVGCLAFLAASLGFASAGASTIVALGASNTFGKGVARNQAYPAQLEAILRARGYGVRVINAGVNGATTGDMLRRLGAVVRPGANVVILQPGGNDRRIGVEAHRAGNIAEIQSRLKARGIRLVIVENSMLHGLPRQADGQHLTPGGYRMLAESLAGQVASAIGK